MKKIKINKISHLVFNIQYFFKPSKNVILTGLNDDFNKILNTTLQ